MKYEQTWLDLSRRRKVLDLRRSRVVPQATCRKRRPGGIEEVGVKSIGDVLEEGVDHAGRGGFVE